MIELHDRVAIVTGGGKGIGAAIALALIAEGCRVAICGRHLETLNDVLATIERQGGKGIPIQANVADESAVDHVINTVVQTFGTVDILVNNAGIGDAGPIHEQNISRWDEIMAVNVRGAFLMCRGILPIMREQKSGHVINIGSEAGLYYVGVNAAYAVSKYALIGLTDCIQGENQDFGIRANVICPGMVITDLTRSAEGLIHENCLRPEEIADVAVALLKQPTNVHIGRPVLVSTMKNPWQA